MKTTIQILTIALLLPVCVQAGETIETNVAPPRTQAPMRHFYIDDNGNAWPVRAAVTTKSNSVPLAVTKSNAAPKSSIHVAIQSTKDSVRPAVATNVPATKPVDPRVLHFANRPAIGVDEVEPTIIKDLPVTLESRLYERAIY